MKMAPLATVPLFTPSETVHSGNFGQNAVAFADTEAQRLEVNISPLKYLLNVRSNYRS